MQRAQNQLFQKENSCLYLKIGCLGSADGSKSAIKFRRKPAISIKVRCLGSADGLKSAISIKVRCLVSAKGSKSAISDGKQLFISYHVLHVNYSH